MLQLKNISKKFKVKDGLFTSKESVILNDISFTVEKNSILGISGQSGSGKSTLGKIIVNIEQATSGKIYYQGEELYKGKDNLIKKDIQIIFQNPYSSLDPNVKVGRLLIHSLKIHFPLTIDEAKTEVENMFVECGLLKSDLEKYPYEFSGGQRQRVIIARALLLKPKIIVCDEITSALDTVTQRQILNLLLKIKEKYSVSYIFITHNKQLLDKFCDEVLELKNGKIRKIK